MLQLISNHPTDCVLARLVLIMETIRKVCEIEPGSTRADLLADLSLALHGTVETLEANRKFINAQVMAAQTKTP